jgi:hypothetical protein
MAKAKPRGKTGWIIGVSVGVVGAITGALIYRGVGTLRITPVTQAQVQAINGEDLKWIPPTTENTVDPSVLAELASRQEVVDVIHLLYPKQSLPDHKEQIRATWPVTQQLGKLTTQKRLAIPNYYLENLSHADVIAQSSDSALKTNSAFKSLAKLLSVQIGLETDLGNGPRCYDACLAAIEYDDLFRRSPSLGIIDYLVREAVSAIVLTAVDNAAASRVLTAEQLQTLYARLAPAQNVDSALVDALVFEWNHETIPLLNDMSSVKGLTDHYRDYSLAMDTDTGGDPSYLACGELDAPATLEKAAQFQRVRIANCARSWKAQDTSVTSEIAAIEKKLPQAPILKGSDGWLSQAWAKSSYRARMSSIRNSLGLQFMTLAVALDVSEISFRNRTQRESHRLMLLFALYAKLHHGALPAGLSDLQPLSGRQPFPHDLFAGGPFHYDPAHRIFWSVGTNGVDDGGKPGPNRFTGPDIVYNVP